MQKCWQTIAGFFLKKAFWHIVAANHVGKM